MVKKFITDHLQIHAFCHSSQNTKQLTCYFTKLFNYLLLGFTLRNRANKEPIIGNRDAYTNVFSRTNFMIVILEEKDIQGKLPKSDY